MSSLEFSGTPVALINVSPRSQHADGQLREILTAMDAVLVADACATLALPSPGIAGIVGPAVKLVLTWPLAPL